MKSRGPVLQWVMNEVEGDPRVCRIGATLRDAGYDVVFVGTRARSDGAGPLLEAADPIDGIPRYLVRMPVLPPLTRWSQALDPRQGPGALRARAAWLAHLGEAVREMLALDPILIHAHDLDAYRVVAHAAAWRHVPLIYDSHELERGRNKPRWNRARHALHAWSERATIARARAVVTVAPSIAQVLAASHGIATPTVVLNTHPRAHVRPNAPLRQRLGLGSQDRVVVYVGGMTEGRGLPTLLRVLPALPPNLHLALYGSVHAGWRDAWRALLEGAGVHRSRVHVMGNVPYADVLHEIWGADAGFNGIELSCESYRHALPNKFFEYAFANVPSISTPTVGVCELLERYPRLGRTYPDTDEAGLVRYLREVAGPTPPTIPTDQHEAFVERHCWEEQARRLRGLYASVIGEPVLAPTRR